MEQSNRPVVAIAGCLRSPLGYRNHPSGRAAKTADPGRMVTWHTWQKRWSPSLPFLVPRQLGIGDLRFCGCFALCLLPKVCIVAHGRHWSPLAKSDICEKRQQTHTRYCQPQATIRGFRGPGDRSNRVGEIRAAGFITVAAAAGHDQGRAGVLPARLSSD